MKEGFKWQRGKDPPGSHEEEEEERERQTCLCRLVCREERSWSLLLPNKLSREEGLIVSLESLYVPEAHGAGSIHLQLCTSLHLDNSLVQVLSSKL